ncbi:MotE family protein [Celeribacter sp. SCSIO 80788]|uniref:MotE family protein n=1 Tax=Celeribacter sp. SCSIO 80788 TaxID=3117013 RepID=UPI003DA5A232
MTQTTPSTLKKPEKARRKRRPGRGALWLIAMVFLASAVIRLVSGTGAAIAREMSELTHGDVAEEHSGAAELCKTDAETSALLEALLKREKDVEERELMLAQKVKAVELARAEVMQNMTALEDAEMRLEATMTRSQSAAEDDLAKLTAVYESMKPKEAAALFEAMSPDFAAGFLGRMRSDAAGAIMAGLTPETAYTISVILAGRNARAPSE